MCDTNGSVVSEINSKKALISTRRRKKIFDASDNGEPATKRFRMLSSIEVNIRGLNSG
jgi:hypothetical protein